MNVPATHQPAPAPAAGPSGFQHLAGMGGRRWAGIGALAGGAIGALSPGKDDDGESRGAVSGALHGALAGGLAGGLGGMAAKRMWGPSAAQKLPGQLGAQQAGLEMQLGQAQQGISQGLGKGIYSPSGYDALRHQGHGMAGAMWKSVMPRWLGGTSGFEMAKAKNNLGMSRELQQLDVNQNHTQAVHGFTNPKGTEPAAAPAAQPAQADFASQADHARASQFAQDSGLSRANQNRERSIDQPIPAKPDVVPQERVNTASFLNPTHIFSPIKKAARQPFKTPKKTVATRVNEAFTATPSKSVEAPKPPEPPKAVTPAKPADAITSTDKKDKTAEVTVPAIDVSSSAVSDAPAAAPVVAAVADVAKVAEVVVPAAEPLIRPIKLAALAQ